MVQVAAQIMDIHVAFGGTVLWISTQHLAAARPWISNMALGASTDHGHQHSLRWQYRTLTSTWPLVATQTTNTNVASLQWQPKLHTCT